MAKQDGGAVVVKDRPRYDDVFHDEPGAETIADGVRVTPAGRKRASDGGPMPKPAIVAAPGQTPQDTDDVDKTHVQRSADVLSTKLGSPEYRGGVYFDWVRTGAGGRLQFSRKYSSLNVLVDLFPRDTERVRHEVAVKRAAIAEHNVDAKRLLADVDAQAKKKLREAKGDVEREAATRWKDESYAYLRREGLMPYGYLPILSGNEFPDVDAAKRGEILDLPPRVEKVVPPLGGIGISRVFRG